MTAFPKPKRIKLTGKAYKDLQERVIRRDNSSCKITGIFTVEPPHHIIYRSSGGSDTEDNLICLSRSIHYNIHHGDPREALEEMVANLGVKRVIQYILQGVLKDVR